MSNLSGIQTLSSRLQMCFNILFWLLPVSATALWFSSVLGASEGAFQAEFDYPISLPLTAMQAFSGYPVAMLTIALMMAIFFQLSRLFGHYKMGDVFGSQPIRRYRVIANLLLLFALSGPVEGLLLGVVLTLDQPEITFNVAVGDGDLGLLLVGLVVRLIAKVMQQAKQLSDEQALTI